MHHAGRLPMAARGLYVRRTYEARVTPVCWATWCNCVEQRRAGDPAVAGHMGVIQVAMRTWPVRLMNSRKRPPSVNAPPAR